MFGSAFRQLWSVATDSAKITAAEIATGARMIGQAPVIAARVESAIARVAMQTGQAVETGVVKTADFVDVKATEWKSWMDVKVAEAGAAARVTTAGAFGGLRGATRQADLEEAKIAQERRRAEAAVASSRSAAESDEAGFDAIHAAERQKLDAANQARMTAAKNLQAEISAAGKRGASRLLPAVEKAGETGQRVADAADQKAAELAHSAWHEIRRQFSRLMPHVCIPCLKGDLALLAGGDFSGLGYSLFYQSVGSLGENLAQHDAKGAYSVIKRLHPDLNAPDPSNPQNPQDGKKIGGDCLGQDAGSKTRGKVPSCCKGKAPSKKITFVNGISTDVIKGTGSKNENICTAMQEIADTACAEVVGVYNATNGMLADLAECVDNILGASTAPAMATLYGDLIKQLRADDSATIEIYAHSQGGLISQEALLRAKETLTAELAPHYGVDGARAEVERRMSRIHVRSFGTAEQGWPSGPMYVHLRNTNDPVPHVIDGAQRDLVGPYDPPEYSQTKAQTFTTPAADLIANHGMKESYIPKLRELRDEGDPSVSDLLDGYDSKNKRCKCE